MPIKMSVRSNMDRVIAGLSQLERDVVDKAVPRALNKVIDLANTATSRKIRDTGYKLKVSDIKKGLRKVRAGQGRLSAKLVATGRPIPLQAYGARQTAKGVSVDVLNGRKVITHAMIVPTTNGGKGVFVRVGKGHKKVFKNGKAIWSGLPIKKLYGPSVPDGMANSAVQEALERLTDERFPQILLQQIKYLSSR